MAAEILRLESEKTLTKKVTHPVRVAVKDEPNPHNFQFFVDYGHSEGGPWLKVCINSNSFGLGYLPEETK